MQSTMLLLSSFLSQIIGLCRLMRIPYTCNTVCVKLATSSTGPEDHHLSFLSRINVDGTTSASGTSIGFLDTGMEVMSFRGPIYMRL